jgi:hypothetical protein
MVKSIPGGIKFMRIAQNNLNLDTIQQIGAPDFKFQSSKIGDLLSQLLPYLFTLAGILLLLYLLWGGFHFMISRGDPKGMQEAKAKITYALIGFVIIFVAYWLVQILGLTLGLSGITNIFQ